MCEDLWLLVISAPSWHKSLLALVGYRNSYMWHADIQGLPAGKRHFLLTIIATLVEFRATEKQHKGNLPGLFAVACNFRVCTSQQVGH